MLKLFKMEKWIIPEWGESQLEMERYFLAHSQETVEAVCRERYGCNGKLEHYYSYDREEMKIKIREIEEVETL